MDCILRPAQAGDADAIAAVFSPSLRLLTFLPELHSIEADRRFIGNVILKECEVTVALRVGVVAGFLARDGEEVRLLHVHPDVIGRGAGSLLLKSAKRAPVAALELWCFQANHGARRFYESHEFRAVRFTDGEGNEERLPDVRYRWDRPER